MGKPSSIGGGKGGGARLFENKRERGCISPGRRGAESMGKEKEGSVRSSKTRGGLCSCIGRVFCIRQWGEGEKKKGCLMKKKTTSIREGESKGKEQRRSVILERTKSVLRGVRRREREGREKSPFGGGREGRRRWCDDVREGGEKKKTGDIHIKRGEVKKPERSLLGCNREGGREKKRGATYQTFCIGEKGEGKKICSRLSIVMKGERGGGGEGRGSWPVLIKKKKKKHSAMRNSAEGERKRKSSGFWLYDKGRRGCGGVRREFALQ